MAKWQIPAKKYIGKIMELNATVWHIEWPETEMIWICWKIKEIASTKLQKMNLFIVGFMNLEPQYKYEGTRMTGNRTNMNLLKVCYKQFVKYQQTKTSGSEFIYGWFYAFGNHCAPAPCSLLLLTADGKTMVLWFSYVSARSTRNRTKPVHF